MYKIVILGCENSHADKFLKTIKENEAYKDVQVIGIYSDDDAAADKLCGEFGVHKMKAYDEFVGNVDGVVVTARHGDNHYKYAKPYIKSGVPMFIDKPITVSESDAVEMMREFKENGVRFCGGSMCIYAEKVQELKAAIEKKEFGEVVGGYVRAPISLENEYGGFYFYSQHLVQMVTQMFGNDIKSVQATKNGKTISIVFRYEKFDITAQFTDNCYAYFGAVAFEKGNEGGVIKLDGCFDGEFETFYSVLTGGESECSAKDFIAPVFILNATERALISGKEEKVNTYEVN